MSDLIVAGGGLAGVSCAVAAAREGLNPIIIEKMPYLGGLATGGLVNPFMTHRTRDGKTKLVGGLFDEIKERLAKHNGILTNCFDPEIMKAVLSEMTEEENINVFFNTEIKKAVYENGIFCIETDRGVFKSARVADCTGDGFVAVSLGCGYEGGDGNCQAVTLMFDMENVNVLKAMEYCKSHPDDFRFPKWNEDTDLEEMQKSAWSLAGFTDIINRHRDEAEFPGDILFFISRPKKGVVTFNQTHFSVNDPTDPNELKKAYDECEKQMRSVIAFANKHIPGFEDAKLLRAADILGVRESRRIMGKYVFSEEDVAFSKKHKDCICRLAYYVDVHKKGEGYSSKDNGAKLCEPKPDDWYEIPFGSLCTEIPGLLVFGKCLSATQKGQGAVRIMPACIAMGEAAGYAMALSQKENIRVSDIDTEKLKEIIRKHGGIV